MEFCVTLKAFAMNIFRAIAAQKARNPEERSPEREKLGPHRIIFVFREHLGPTWGELRDILAPVACTTSFSLKWPDGFLRRHRI